MEDKYEIKGKSRRKTQKPVTINKMDLPSEFTDIQDLQLCIDIVRINEMTFITCIGRPVRCRPASKLPNRKAEEL